MKLNGISKNKIVQQVSRIGNRPAQAGLSGSHHHPHHPHHQLPPQPPSPRQGRTPQQAHPNTPATRSRRLQNEQLQNLQFRRTSSGLSAECLQLNAMQINSPPQSPMHSPRRRSSVEVEPSRLSFSSTNPLFVEAELVADNPPQEFFQIQIAADQPEEGTHRGRRSSGSGICSFNFTPALPINFSATFTSSNNSSASSANSSTSASPATSPSSSPAPGLSASARSTPMHTSSVSTSFTSTTTTTITTTTTTSSSSQPEHGAQTTPKKILKAKRSALPMFTDSPLPRDLSAVAPPQLPPLPPPPLPTQLDEESMATSEGKEEFAVPRPQQTKRKTSQVEPENPVPPAILNRRRGAISYTEAPQQLKDLVERLNKRPKLS